MAPRLALVIGLLFSLSACVTVEEQPVKAQNPELRRTSVISTSDPGFNPQPGARVAWYNDITVHAPQGEQVPDEVLARIKNNIEANLIAKGFSLAPASGTTMPDYWMHGLMVLGDDLNEKTLGNMLGFEPGLMAHNRNYEKGSLLLILINPRNVNTKWRGAVQVMTDASLSEKERNQRIDFVIHSLMRPLPNLTQGG